MVNEQTLLIFIDALFSQKRLPQVLLYIFEFYSVLWFQKVVLHSSCAKFCLSYFSAMG